MVKVTPKKVLEQQHAEPQRNDALEWREAFITSLRALPVVKTACAQAKVSRKTVYHWRERDLEFRADWDEAVTEGIEILEAVAHARARQTSDTLLIFLLKNLKPGQYKDRMEHTGPGGGPIKHSFDLTRLSDQELEQWHSLALKATRGVTEGPLASRS